MCLSYVKGSLTSRWHALEKNPEVTAFLTTWKMQKRSKQKNINKTITLGILKCMLLGKDIVGQSIDRKSSLKKNVNLLTYYPLGNRNTK